VAGESFPEVTYAPEREGDTIRFPVSLAFWLLRPAAREAYTRWAHALYDHGTAPYWAIQEFGSGGGRVAAVDVGVAGQHYIRESLRVWRMERKAVVQRYLAELFR
jgi:hypothetical protein